MSSDPSKVDPLIEAGIELPDLPVEELVDMYDKSGAAKAYKDHLAALESCRVNPETLRNVIVGPGTEE